MQTIHTIHNKKGVTLIEMLMVVALFALVMGAMTGVFGASIKAKKTIETVQKNYQNAQTAMNVMAKSLRTSSVIASDSNHVVIYDYSQSQCITYYYNSTSKALYKAFYSENPVDANTCSAQFNGNTITQPIIASAFFSAESTAGNIRGKVTITAKVCGDPDPSRCDEQSAVMQTTTSLRDYAPTEEDSE